jgi:hypothetical protein
MNPKNQDTHMSSFDILDKLHNFGLTKEQKTELIKHMAYISKRFDNIKQFIEQDKMFDYETVDSYLEDVEKTLNFLEVDFGII